MLLGHCRDCDGPYESDVPADGLCPICQAHEDAVYQNDPSPYVSTNPWAMSKGAMRERLGVSGDEDV